MCSDQFLYYINTSLALTRSLAYLLPPDGTNYSINTHLYITLHVYPSNF